MAKNYTIDKHGNIHWIKEPVRSFDPAAFYLRQQAWMDRQAIKLAAKKQQLA